LKKLEKLFGGIDNVLKNIETAEEIIKNVTILYNDKKMMVEKIIKQNPDFDSDEKRLIIRNLKFLG
jgi:hypothetical protein